MLILAAAIATALTAAPDRAAFQLMTSPAFQAFAGRSETSCPARKLRYLHPADLDGIEEDFVPSLTKPQRSRLAHVDRGTKECAPAGLSCPAQHELEAIRASGLFDEFVAFACTSSV